MPGLGLGGHDLRLWRLLLPNPMKPGKRSFPQIPTIYQPDKAYEAPTLASCKSGPHLSPDGPESNTPCSFQEGIVVPLSRPQARGTSRLQSPTPIVLLSTLPPSLSFQTTQHKGMCVVQMNDGSVGRCPCCYVTDPCRCSEPSVTWRLHQMVKQRYA